LVISMSLSSSPPTHPFHANDDSPWSTMKYLIISHVWTSTPWL
jgi:hypothetical protein